MTSWVASFGLHEGDVSPVCLKVMLVLHWQPHCRQFSRPILLLELARKSLEGSGSGGPKGHYWCVPSMVPLTCTHMHWVQADAEGNWEGSPCAPDLMLLCHSLQARAAGTTTSQRQLNV